MLSLSDNGETDRFAGVESPDFGHELLRSFNLILIDGDDDVAAPQSGLFSGRIGHDVAHDRSLFFGHAVRLGELLRQRLDVHAEPSASHLPVLYEIVHDLFRHIHRDGEADSLREGYNGRIDSDHLAVQIDEGPAAVSGVDRRIGLEESVKIHVFRMDAPVFRRNDPDGHGMLQSVRIAYRDDPLPDLGFVRVAHFEDRQVGSFDFDDGEVKRGIASQNFRLEIPSVGHCHRNLVGALNHVVVGQDFAVRRNDEPRTAPLHRDRSGVPLEFLAEKAAKNRVVGKGRVGTRHHRLDIDIHDGRRRLPGDLCNRVPCKRLLRRHGPGQSENTKRDNSDKDRSISSCYIHRYHLHEK